MNRATRVRSDHVSRRWRSDTLHPRPTSNLSIPSTQATSGEVLKGSHLPRAQPFPNSIEEFNDQLHALWVDLIQEEARQQAATEVRMMMEELAADQVLLRHPHPPRRRGRGRVMRHHFSEPEPERPPEWDVSPSLASLFGEEPRQAHQPSRSPPPPPPPSNDTPIMVEVVSKQERHYCLGCQRMVCARVFRPGEGAPGGGLFGYIEEDESDKEDDGAIVRKPPTQVDVIHFVPSSQCYDCTWDMAFSYMECC